MYPQKTDTDRFHGIDDTYTYRLIETAVSDGRITGSDADLIRLYIAERKATKNIGVKRCYKIASSLITVRRFVLPFRENTILSIYSGIEKIHAEQSKRHEAYKLNSKRDLIIILKSFYLWLLDNEEISLPLKKIKAIQPPGVDTNTKSAQDLLTPDEIQQIINACSWSRDRALFFMMYEGGFRVGEIGCMKWGDLRFDGAGIIVNVTFKNGKPRYIRLVMSKEYLATWKADYPLPVTDDSLLFLNSRNMPLTHGSVTRQLERITKKAGITKHITPHLFRHSRITHLMQQGISESVIKLMMWGSVTSQMFATYAHLTGSDIDRELFNLYGLTEDQKKQKDKSLEPKICPCCKEICSPISKFCSICGQLLDSTHITDNKQLQDLIIKNASAISEYLNKLSATPKSQ